MTKGAGSMLNEEKIKLMTSIAMFEKKEGKRLLPSRCYFKSDYISRHLLIAFFGYTLCCFLGLALWGLYDLETLLGGVDLDKLLIGAVRYLVFYLAGLVVYMLLTAFVYWKRYDHASGSMRIYVAKLKRLEKRYEYQSKVKEIH